MYSPTWLSNQSLIDQLTHEPWRWQYAQAVRLLEASKQSIRFKSDPSYRYPCADQIKVRKNGSGWMMTSTLPALDGFNGVLPYVYQDIERHQRLNRDDSDMHGFWSVFNDRILNLTAAQQLRCKLNSRYEQRHRRGGVLANTLLTIMGLPFPKHIPPDNLFFYAGLLSRKTTSLELLAAALNDYFRLDIQLIPPPIVRMPLAPDSLTRMRNRVDHHTSCVGYLGQNTLIGKSCYLLHSRVNVIIRVKNKEQYQAVTRDKKLAPALLEFCHIYFGGDARFRIQVYCPRHCLVSPKLSVRHRDGVARLGRLSCLMPELHPDELVVVDFRAVGT